MQITLSLSRGAALAQPSEVVVTVDALNASAAEMPFVQSLVAHVGEFANAYLSTPSTLLHGQEGAQQ